MEAYWSLATESSARFQAWFEVWLLLLLLLLLYFVVHFVALFLFIGGPLYPTNYYDASLSSHLFLWACTAFGRHNNTGNFFEGPDGSFGPLQVNLPSFAFEFRTWILWNKYGFDASFLSIELISIFQPLALLSWFLGPLFTFGTSDAPHLPCSRDWEHFILYSWFFANLGFISGGWRRQRFNASSHDGG